MLSAYESRRNKALRSIEDLRESLSTCFAVAALEVRLKLKPWRYALRPVRVLPAAERGPVLLPALRRFASICRSLVTVKPKLCLRDIRG
jgi:hypothetical protein